MSKQEMLVSVQQFVDALNGGDLQSIGRYMSTDFFAHTPAENEPTQAEVYHDLAADLWTALPDLRVAVQDLHVEDGLIKGQMTLSGTHTGPAWGAPASGNTLSWTVDIFLRPVGDRFALSLENVSLPDLLVVLRQMELIQPPDQMDRPLKYPVVIPEIIMKAIFTGQVADKRCSHLDDIQVTDTSIDVCNACLAQGDTVWPALRMCLICGHVGCCDTSKNKHAKQHYQETGHALIRSIRLDESWVWCYEDNAFFSGRVLDKYR